MLNFQLCKKCCYSNAIDHYHFSKCFFPRAFLNSLEEPIGKDVSWLFKNVLKIPCVIIFLSECSNFMKVWEKIVLELLFVLWSGILALLTHCFFSILVKIWSGFLNFWLYFFVILHYGSICLLKLLRNLGLFCLNCNHISSYSYLYFTIRGNCFFILHTGWKSICKLV